MDRHCRTRSGQAGAQTPLLYSLSLLIVFLCLAALYESWTHSDRGAAGRAARHPRRGAGVNTLRGMERDVYFQVAMLTTVGLSSKNAILIVEFAKENLDEGHGADRGDACRPCAIACVRS